MVYGRSLWWGSASPLPRDGLQGKACRAGGPGPRRGPPGQDRGGNPGWLQAQDLSDWLNQGPEQTPPAHGRVGCWTPVLVIQ